MNRRTVFWLWLPLALSFTFMMLEGPTVQSAIARLDAPALNLAAFGMVFGIALIIESPVIMLVSTAIALTKDAQSYRLLRRFMIGLNIWLTVLTGLVAWTPLFDLVAGSVLGMPDPIIDAGRPAMQLMLFWTAAIGWRRFYQGILVRYGYTRRVSYGTAIRLLTNVVVAFALVVWGEASGANVGVIILNAGVMVEALLTHLMAHQVVRKLVLTNTTVPDEPLTMRRIAAFHIPLAATSLLTLLVQPVTAAALARLALPRETLAAWPVVFSTLLVLRGWGLALQETTIAQSRVPGMMRPLRDFTFIVAGVTSLATALLAFSPLIDLHLDYVIGLAPELRGLVRTGIQISLLLPALSTITSWMRGLIMAAGATGRIYRGMLVNLLVNCAILVAGVVLNSPGVPLAAVALTLASAAEYLYLRRPPALHSIQASQQAPLLAIQPARAEGVEQQA
jgi:hypothetical protein